MMLVNVALGYLLIGACLFMACALPASNHGAGVVRMVFVICLLAWPRQLRNAAAAYLAEARP